MPATLTKLPNKINNKDWNVTWDSKNNCTSDDQGIRVAFDKGGYASAAGAHFRAEPKSLPATSVELKYPAVFDKDFDWVKGGKLPGLWGGAPGAGGGEWNDKGYSFRVMFREGGQAVAYIYMCTDQGTYSGDEKCKLVKNQGKGFDDIAHHTNGAGIDLWRQSKMKFVKGSVNTVAIKLTVNSPGKADGLVQLTVNGETQRFDGMQWCEKPKKVEGIVFASWMGGGDDSYAPHQKQGILFRDVTLTTSG